MKRTAPPKNISYIDIGGALLHINWAAFRRGSSFFIPCIKCRSLRLQILKKATFAQVQVGCKYVIEKGVRGIRVWRVF